jgi:NTP pyrophosphatase (non-canonical NTP hydrolase)
MLNEVAVYLHNIAKSKGFWDNERDVPEVLMLIVSEAAEALEEYREGKSLTEIRYTDDGKPEGFPTELADIIIRVLDACVFYKIDIDAAMEAKATYNAKRPHMHGKTC